MHTLTTHGGHTLVTMAVMVLEFPLSLCLQNLYLSTTTHTEQVLKEEWLTASQLFTTL